MAKRVSSTAIGGFVLVSIGLAVVALVILGSGKLLQRPHYYICMFQGNLNGLKVGAAVKIRGVQIGTVKQITLRLRPGQGKLQQINLAQQPMAVLLEVDEREFESIGGKTTAFTPERLKMIINAGLRAQLAMESFLTGILYIDVGFHPNTRLRLYIVPDSGPYPEVPTIPTQLEQIREDATKALAKIGEIDFKKLGDSITDAGLAVKGLAGDPELHQAINSVSRIVGDPDLKKAVDQLQETLVNVNKAVISVRKTIDRTGDKIDPLIASFQKTSGDLQVALAQARSTLASAQLVLSPGSPMTHKLDATLSELTDASRSIHDLADYLQRNPSALIRGKYVSDGNR
ncbi:MAG TPA: MlaD family protein [Candidatus Binataceae bacterium]|jgi:paraquat-inducible protein B|nr:MlaD family protein [Candidatus Binataceae bacterium]